MAKKIVGICAICRENKKLSFEHSPPRAAFNDRQVKIKDYRHIVPSEENKYLYGKTNKSNKGLGGYTLCVGCNNFIGANYCKSYINLAHEIYPLLDDSQNFIRMSIVIEPLNFIKQVLVMFLCADRSVGSISTLINSKKLILDCNEKYLKNGIKVYMYATKSNEHRMIGLSALYLNGAIGRYAECNYHPFGFLFSDDSKKPNQKLYDISHFAEYNFNERKVIDINLPILDVKGLAIGTYS